MAVQGLLPSTEIIKVIDSLAGGESEILRGFGTRLAVSASATGDDIWAGTATTLPIPPDAGEQMEVLSTSASDTLAGTGAQKVTIHYIDAVGAEKQETVNMNGATPVQTAATNIRFVQQMHVTQAGTGLLAAGIIRIRSVTTPANIYTQIEANTNQSLNTARMVPAGKALVIRMFNAAAGAAAGGKSADIRLRATSHGFLLTPRLFHFIDNFLGFNSATNRLYPDSIVIPPLAIVKCTSYATVGGADVQASWEGVLIQTPV